MAKVPLPERGQPLDVTYIYQLADALNDVSAQVSSATYNYTSVDTLTSGKQTRKTSEARIVGRISALPSNVNVTAGEKLTFTAQFDGDFAFAPIVSATPVNLGGSAGNDVSVTVTSVTTGRVDGIVTFNTAGQVSVVVHVLAIGVAN